MMTNKRKYYVKYWLPLFVYCTMILTQSLLGISVGWLRVYDKSIHFFVYMLLGFLIIRAVTTISKGAGIIFAVIVSVVASSIVGVADEVFQIFSPTRTIDRIDICFDFLGSLSGIILFLFIRMVEMQKKNIY